MAAQEAAAAAGNTTVPPAPSKPIQRERRKPPRQRKLRPPRTAVITITLKPGAEEKGVRYESVLAEAKSRVKLGEVGLTSVRFRTTATGARMLEVPPGTNEPEKAADALAAKLREVLDQNEVQINRPTKCVEIRVMDLDDAVSAEEVVAAVAAEGGCPDGAIRPGVVVRGFNGCRSLWLSCPVAAAKKILASGRVKVGWISARVLFARAEAAPLLQMPRGRATWGPSATGTSTAAVCASAAVGLTTRPEIVQPQKQAAPYAQRLANRRRMPSAAGRVLRTEPALREVKPEERWRRGPSPRPNGPWRSQWRHRTNGSALSSGQFKPLCQSSGPPSPKHGRVANRRCSVVSEPYVVHLRDDWVSDPRRSWWLIVAPAVAGSPAIEGVARGRGFVVAGLAEFEQLLVEVGALIGQASPNSVLVAGDFNAKSTAWGSPATDARGEALGRLGGLAVGSRGDQQWVGEHPAVFKSGGCGDGRGDSIGIIDTSDSMSPRFQSSGPLLSGQKVPRWSLGRLDSQLAKEAAIVEAWLHVAACIGGGRNSASCGEPVLRLAASTPGAGEDVCVTATWRRPFYTAYRDACDQLKKAIAQAERGCVARMARDAGERPMGETVPGRETKTPTLDPPHSPALSSHIYWRELWARSSRNAGILSHHRWHPEAVTTSAPDHLAPPVTESELVLGSAQAPARRRQPQGPDGIPGRALAIALGEMGDSVRRFIHRVPGSRQVPRSVENGKARTHS
ncbi:uncharacterized protein LOC124540908 [Vanessa cardui]|uniref:uncharacterized protein LOC124540908 n=1 Tax=Vanessa cardui TaxID=171605 RepID=UPI001F13B081|nr:uncharacterized protein LOC124540908 [Vanessa cardui]